MQTNTNTNVRTSYIFELWLSETADLNTLICVFLVKREAKVIKYFKIFNFAENIKRLPISKSVSNVLFRLVSLLRKVTLNDNIFTIKKYFLNKLQFMDVVNIFDSEWKTPLENDIRNNTNMHSNIYSMVKKNDGKNDTNWNVC